LLQGADRFQLDEVITVAPAVRCLLRDNQCIQRQDSQLHTAEVLHLRRRQDFGVLPDPCNLPEQIEPAEVGIEGQVGRAAERASVDHERKL